MTTLSAHLAAPVALGPRTTLVDRLRSCAAAFARDPRHYQMTAQAALYLGGIAWLDFEVPLARAALTLATTVGTQWVCTAIAARLQSWAAARRAGESGVRPAAPIRFEWRSALISGTGLCLLLRTPS